MDKKIKVICANDSMELAFLPNVPNDVIEKEMEKLEEEYEKRNYHVGIQSRIYFHIHEVKLWGEI